MSECVVCQHAKVQAIDAAILQGRRLGVIAAQFRLQKEAVQTHITHQWPSSARSTGSGLVESMAMETRPLAETQATVVIADGAREDPMRRVKHHVREAADAWREVEAPRRTPERLHMILQEAFAEADMGL